MELKNYFDRVVLINLKRRPERLGRINRALEECSWPFRRPQVVPAVDGRKVPTPDGWQSRGGAWGCMRSHQRVLEDAIIDEVENLLVLEDDACFAENFRERVETFLREVPDDWDQLMLGGQHVNTLGTPTRVKPGIYRCTDCERTHCYAIRGSFMRTLYKRWIAGGRLKGEVHCDWIMGRDPNLQKRHKVYAPDPFLVGQERGKSDITHGSQPRQFWNPPRPETPVLFLEAPQSAVAVLRQYGIHTGYRRDENSDLDQGLIKIFERNRSDRTKLVKHLAKWIEQLQWEVASDPHLICTVWHPEATLEMVEEASQWPVIAVAADSPRDVLNQLPPELRRPFRPNLAKQCLVHLRAPKHVMDALRARGWHNGYWRDERTGLDIGLSKLLRKEDPNRSRELLDYLQLLQNEADAIVGGVPVVWHPDLDSDSIRAATDSTLIEIQAADSREAEEIWSEEKRRLTEKLTCGLEAAPTPF